MCGRDVMVTRGGSYTHEAAGHAAMVSTEIKSKEEGIIFSVSVKLSTKYDAVVVYNSAQI